MLFKLNLFFGTALMAMAAGCAGQNSRKAEQAAQGKYITFTFDDGPSEKTDLLLELLAENNVKAAFFLIGQNVANRPEQARRILSAGHEIGNHSNGYAGLGMRGGNPPIDSIRESLGAASASIKTVCGIDTVFFRAPNLDYSGDLESVAGEMGMALIGTDVSGKDWEADISTDQIIENVLKSAKDGGIILLHERHSGDLERTIRALPVIVRELREQGYGILSLSELAKKKGVSFEAGRRYDIIE
jgi:peptidoglycan/xylan/chitin deacetylase (PgdA/CDA1 family)